VWALVRCIFGRAPMADAMENCQKGMLVDAIAMLSRFHGTMGLSRSSRMIFQPSATCGNLKWEPSAPRTRVASIVRMRLHCVQVVHLLKLADMPDRVDGHAQSFHSMCQQVVLPARFHPYCTRSCINSAPFQSSSASRCAPACAR